LSKQQKEHPKRYKQKYLFLQILFIFVNVKIYCANR
jgi:hypothetical protein